jgi:hypothetical protein
MDHSVSGGPGLPGWGVSRIGKIKHGFESHGTALVRTSSTVNYRPVLSSERALSIVLSFI